MANPKIPPEIAKKIAAMKPAAPAPSAPPSAKAAPAARAPGTPGISGGLMPKVAIAGWVLAAVAGGVAFVEVKTAEQQKAAALAAQAADYDARLAAKDAEIRKVQDEAAATVKRAQDEAAGKVISIKAELDYAKMPEIPLETVARANQVLYVNNDTNDTFACKVKLYREYGNVSKEVDFSIKAKAFQDMGSIGDWVFAKGDKVDFIKPGFKPRSLVIQ